MLLGRTEEDFVKEAQDKECAKRWKDIFSDMQQYGVRFSYHTAPAPNTSTA